MPDIEILNDNVVDIDDPAALETARPIFADGNYNAVIESVNYHLQPEGRPYAGHKVVDFAFTLDDDALAEHRGYRLRETCSTEKGSGWKYRLFMTGLGATDNNGVIHKKIDLKALVGMEVLIHVKPGVGTKIDPRTGELTKYNNVQEVTPR